MSAPTMECACGENWVIEVCDLATGQVRTRWLPLSAEWQVSLNQVGVGSVTLPSGAITSRDIWPGLTSVYISRIAGRGASPENPIAEFAGIVSEFGASESGATVVGLLSIESYLERRVINTDVRWNRISQTLIGARLVQLAESDGIPLRAEAAPSDILRDREFFAWSFKEIGEAVQQLTEVIDGPDWELRHERVEGRWSTTMVFRDFVGEDNEIQLRSDIEGSAYSLSVSAEDLANHVFAIGAGEEEDQLVAAVNDASGIYPRFDATPSWKDVTRLNTLFSHADGYLDINREPDARPTMTVHGLDPDPLDLKVGDIVNVSMGYGPISFRGKSRITSVSWTLDPESPESRTFELVPMERASRSILNQRPDPDHCEDC